MTATASFVHPTIRKLFANRRVSIATMHGKDLIMRPLVKQYLCIDSCSVKGLDTDEFGTFTSEKKRPWDPVTTLRKKILKGMEITGETLGIGNEGSFGPHPTIPFIQSDQEVCMLIDLENDLEIFETITSTETNHSRKKIESHSDLAAFADEVGFPSHGLILKQVAKGKTINQRKGIMHWEELHPAFNSLASLPGYVVAETDMRAYLNPTRMKIIERATEKLLRKVTNLCPECHWPGFACVGTQPGLPCSDCGYATDLVAVKVYQCANCSYTDERYYTSGEKADPRQCNQCNP